jgi:thiamine transport system substrate-binding protein
MKIQSRVKLLLVIIFLTGLVGLSGCTQQGIELTIYTYDSLFADPFYDLIGNFSKYSGISEESIQLVRLSDANEIVARLLAEKDRPQADVIIGIDNTLIHLIENISEVIEPYTPSNIDQIDPNLIQNLDPEKYLIPYDFGIISLYYQNQIINASTHSELSNLTLDNLLTSELLSKLIVENPKFSSPGLGFLLWTIAVYGDPEIQFNGLLENDWRDWWKEAKDSVTVTKSWGDAFNIFFTPAEGKPIMVSYGTSPAYSYCQWQDDTTSAVVTHENNNANAWLQIEGIGLVNNAPQPTNGKQFIDWFLGEEVQTELPEHQWMYPANEKAILSECFNHSVISPEEVYRLNDLITPTLLKEYLTYWQDEWEKIMVLGTSITF